MTVTQIVVDYLKQNGFDGLHSHAEDNSRYAGCGCSIKDFCEGGCPQGDFDPDCEPAYKHTKADCKKCPDNEKCEPFSFKEKFMYCGKKKV